MSGLFICLKTRLIHYLNHIWLLMTVNHIRCIQTRFGIFSRCKSLDQPGISNSLYTLKLAKISLLKAGMALINLWRKEWKSNEIAQVASSRSGWNSVRRNLFNGEYTINVRSGKSGELIESRNISISNKNCIQLKQQEFWAYLSSRLKALIV